MSDTDDNGDPTHAQNTHRKSCKECLCVDMVEGKKVVSSKNMASSVVSIKKLWYVQPTKRSKTCSAP